MTANERGDQWTGWLISPELHYNVKTLHGKMECFSGFHLCIHFLVDLWHWLCCIYVLFSWYFTLSITFLYSGINLFSLHFLLYCIFPYYFYTVYSKKIKKNIPLLIRLGQNPYIRKVFLLYEEKTTVCCQHCKTYSTCLLIYCFSLHFEYFSSVSTLSFITMSNFGRQLLTSSESSLLKKCRPFC